MADAPVAYILGTFPQPSQTFIAREVRGLLRAGVPLLVFALSRRSAHALEPPDHDWFPQVRRVPRAGHPAVLAANLRFLWLDPARYLRTLTRLVALPHRPRRLALRAPVLVFRAAWIAREIVRAGGCRQIHAHFALAQTEVAMAISGLLDCPFSFTAHARDIYRTPSALQEKIRAARLVVSCTNYNVEHLRRLCPDVAATRIRLVHHGVEQTIGGATRPRHSPLAPPLLLAAGRLVEKKGFDTLIAACGKLRSRGIAHRCAIYGTGEGLGALEAQARVAGLEDTVTFPGWASTPMLADAMSQATAFVMPSRVSAGGDRDGIPNVILEAMSEGVPVVATRVSGIPEAVVAGVTGLLVDPDEPEQLADALEQLVRDRSLAHALGDAGRQRVKTEFHLDVSSARLAGVFNDCARDDEASDCPQGDDARSRT